jgi:flagellar hook assembly protein FlgD
MKRIYVLMIAFIVITLAFPVTAEQKPKYISPNSDGVQDELVIPLHIIEKRYVVSWNLIITAVDGKTVRTIGNKVALPEKITFKSFFRQLVTPKHGVDIPAAVSWNGVMDNGETAPDGTYNYYFTATDDNGNTGKTDIYQVVVDTQAPDIRLSQSADRIFGEGAKSEFKINQSGSSEDKWIGRFKKADGTVVRTYEWSGEPLSFSWNGNDNSGIPVADGVYSYDVMSTDRAGNRSTPASIPNIIFSAEKPATNIIISGSKYFSPGTDSRLSAITLNVTIPVPTADSGNKLTEWAVEIIGEDGKVSRRYDQKQSAVPPEQIIFDGTDVNGKKFADGRYQAKVTAKYLNGFETSPISSPVFILDTGKPDAHLLISDKVFGAGDKTTLTISEMITPKKYAPVVSWTGTIYASDDMKKVVRQYNLGEFPPEKVTWDGFDDSGKLAANGSYVYEMSAMDLAGNTGHILSEPFSLDTSNVQLMLVMKDKAFSPNNDNVKDTEILTPVLQTGIGGITQYVFRVSTADGKAVRTISGTKAVPASFAWDGHDDSGILCSDGTYTAALEITSANGSKAAVSTQPFTLDTKQPYLSAEIPWSSFSPDGTSRQQTLPVTIKNCTDEGLWTASVKNAKNVIVWKSTWKGTVQTDGKPGFEWNGTDESGNKASDGQYVLILESQDEAGNSFTTSLKGLTLDSREVKAYVTTEYDGISPNGDNNLESQKFTIRTTVPDGISSWHFDVCKENGQSVRSWSNKDSSDVPAEITWDGLDADGVPGEGTFTGVLKISYKKGNDIQSVSSPFVCTATPPVLTVLTAPEYFSPDNDGTDDDLFIKLHGATKAAVHDWSFTINDPVGRVFWKTAGKASITERIVWDGLSNTQKDASGIAERVQSAMDYPWTFVVTDTLGMTSTVTGTIPVDVLVIRDGNVLKMAVPSIIFRSDNADFKIESVPGKKDGVTKEQAEKNERVLKRIAEILNKFKDYKVTVVGHANPTTDNIDEETVDNPKLWGPALIPLSEKRAEYVKDYLVKKGVSSSRLSTDGKGGTQLVVDWKDKENNWKNRRVEFILEK